MQKRMNPLTVVTRDGEIWIEQVYGEDDCGVAINPDQLPTLIKWLQEAAEEIASDQGKLTPLGDQRGNG